MNLAIEPALLERAVFHATRSEPPLAHEYQRAFAGCYREPAGDRREQAFADLHERWFDRLGFRRRLLDRVQLFPHVVAEVRRIVVADARTRGRSSVELFGKPGGYALVIAVTPSLLNDPAAFDYWARFELMHVEDMLDPAFAYDKSAQPDASSAAAETRTRDRYALLWAITIDARLAALPTAPAGLRDRRRNELARGFKLNDPAACDAAMEQLWPASSTAVRPAHPMLLAWSRTGVAGGEVAPECSPASKCAPTPGSRCPLCRFPTFDWADAAVMSEGLCSTVQADFPAWTSDAGLCGRCAELYRARAPLHCEQVPA